MGDEMGKRLHNNILEINKNGIFIEIYKQYVEGYDIEEIYENNMNIDEFIGQMKGIMEMFPNLVCVKSFIEILNNYQYSGENNEFILSWELGYEKNLHELINDVEESVEENCYGKNRLNNFIILKNCNILCVNKNQQPKKSRRTNMSKSIRHEVFKRDNYKCVECGVNKDETSLHIDHILPVSQGGSDELDNLQTLCQDCNLAKSNRFWKGGN